MIADDRHSVGLGALVVESQLEVLVEPISFDKSIALLTELHSSNRLTPIQHEFASAPVSAHTSIANSCILLVTVDATLMYRN